MDPDGAVFLMRVAEPASGRLWWITPGGGIDGDEKPVAALRRELTEEIGLELPANRVGPPLWHRRVDITWDGRRVRQHETYYLIETDRFEPVRCCDGDPGSGMIPAEPRWWTAGELHATSNDVAPRRLPGLIDQLRGQGPPPTVLDLEG